MSKETLDLLENDSISATTKGKKKKHRSRSKKSSDSEIDSDSFLEYNLKYESQLQDKPEILAFILHLQEFIRKQEKKIKKLKSSIKKFHIKSKTKNVSTQTNELIEQNDKSNEPKTITEEIKEAAENAMLQTGFVYEETSGMYYDYNTGYYYNAELGLYYDGNNGTYLVYNDETKSYDFHSQVEVIPTLKEEITAVKRKKQRKKQEGGKRSKIKIPASETNPLEEGECSSSDSEDRIYISSDELESSELAQSWPPCMRLILKETSIEKLKIGSLFIITCDGGKIGREGDQSILIPDINVSKTHAEIIFDREKSLYTITDLGSQNGTLLNGKRISGPKEKSEPHDVVHGSVVQFGSTKLLCHVHDGQKTCGHCEPGLIQAEVPTQTGFEKPVSKSNQYKRELKRIRKKFGLEAQENCQSEPAAGYSDRAKERRKFVGSHDGNEKTQVASLHESINAENKGFKMLAKMGWNEGQSLGKDGSGLTEPVALVSNEGRTGLGSSQIPTLPTQTSLTEKKMSLWKKTQQRYNQVQEVNLTAFNYSSEEEEEKEKEKGVS